MPWIRSTLAAALLLTLTSCDYIFGGLYGISQDIHNLHAFTIGGHVTDEHDAPLTTATLIMNGKPPEPLKSPYFSKSQRGAVATFTFAAPGYYPRSYEYSDDGLSEALTDSPDIPSFPVQLLTPVREDPLHVHVVLDKIEHPAHLLNFATSLHASVGSLDAVRFAYFDIDHPDAWSPKIDRSKNETAPPAFPPNTLYIIADSAPDNPRLFASSFEKGDTIACPRQMRLVSTSAAGGVQLIPFDNGHYLQGRPRLAPEAGYQKEIALTADTLRQLGQHHYLPFFFQAANVYGRGIITGFYATGSQREHSVDQVTLYVTVRIQPDGTRNVE